MFTHDELMVKVLRWALREATKDWSEEQKKDLSERAFQNVAVQEYKSKIEYPIMKPIVVEL